MFYPSFSMVWKIGFCHLNPSECFQGEIAKRILKLPKWYSNSAAIIALGWNSLHSVCTIRKLRFLQRVMTNEESICHRAFSALVDNAEALSLVRECRELEERYKSNFTSEILSANEPADGLDIIRSALKIINKKDQLLLLQKISKYQFVHKIAECVGWKKLWDHALDHGPSVIKGMKKPFEGDYLPRSFAQQMSTVRCSCYGQTNSGRTCHHQPHKK